MSQSDLCRLCVKASKDYKSLYNDNGLGNELYQTIVKYFHPVILDMDKWKNLQRICMECWSYINNFQNFQDTIRVAQVRLLDHVDAIVIKTEPGGELEDTIRPSTSRKTLNSSSQRVDQEFISLPEMDLVKMTKTENITGSDSTCDISDSEILSKKDPNWSEVESNDEDDDLSPDYELSSKNKQNSKARSHSDEIVQFHPNYPLPDDTVLSSELELTESDSDNDVNMDNDDPTRPSTSDLQSTLESSEKRKRTREHMEQLMLKYLPILKCIACANSFTNLRELQHHFRQFHPKKKFYVMCCNLKLPVPTRLREHLILHSDPEAFKCRLCGKTYSLRSGLQTHIALRHPEEVEIKIYNCRKCHKSYDSARRLSSHVKVAHMRREASHEEESDRPKRRRRRRRSYIPPDGPCAFTCEECGKQFDKYRSFNQHQWYSHRLEPKHICVTCGKSFKLKYDLRKHEAIHSGYACAFCPRTFTIIGDLYNHRNEEHADRAGNFVRK